MGSKIIISYRLVRNIYPQTYRSGTVISINTVKKVESLNPGRRLGGNCESWWGAEASSHLMLSNQGFVIAIVSFFRYSLALIYSSGDGSSQ